MYLDESGDHRLDKIDQQFPIFALIAAVIDQFEYCDSIMPAINRLKFKYFGSEEVILHSYEIRKARGAFKILLNPETRNAFLEDRSNTYSSDLL